MKMTLSVMAIALLSHALTAQPTHNITVLGRSNPGTFYSDIWGYAAPGVGEWALLCDQDRTWLIDCTDPTKPVAVTSVDNVASSWQPSSWRDVKTYDHYAYVISEGGGGMQIIDLTDPGQPVLVTTWGQSLWTHAHNLAIDTDAGLAFVFGTNVGMQVLDLTDPAAPLQITTYAGSGFLHDGHAQHGRLYAADLRTNELVIFDTTALPNLPILGRATMPAASSAHSAWATWDDSTCLTTNEVPGGPFATWDVTNVRLPHPLATVSLSPQVAMPHGVFARDRLAHLAYYTEGYAILDIGDPAHPKVIASVDTFAGTSGGFNGVWGVYPFSPSGVVYLSDMGTGLWIVQSPAVSRRLGSASPGSAGDPMIRPAGAPWLGNASFALELADAAPAQPCALLVGTTAATQSVLGVTLQVALQGALLLPLRTDESGRAKVPFPVPDDGSLIGRTVLGQFVVVDPAGSAGIAATAGLALTPFAP